MLSIGCCFDEFELKNVLIFIVFGDPLKALNLFFFNAGASLRWESTTTTAGSQKTKRKSMLSHIKPM